MTDYLHCPGCRDRLAQTVSVRLTCSECGRAVPIVGGIPDLLGTPSTTVDRGFQFGRYEDPVELAGLIRSGAGDRWPESVGHTILLGCGSAEFVRTFRDLDSVRDLIVLDEDFSILENCITRSGHATHTAYVRTSDSLADVRDAVANTVVCTKALAGAQDTRAVLTAIHRVLQPRGRAFVVVPNRRFIQALSAAIGAVLSENFRRDHAWPAVTLDALTIVARGRRLMLQARYADTFAGLPEKHLFEREAIEQLSREVGFANAEAIPLQPDPTGARAAARLVRPRDDNGAEALPTAVTATGRPWFDLLDRRDSSLSMLLCLTKARGPEIRIFNHKPDAESEPPDSSEALLDGMPPRWSAVLTARETPAGIAMKVFGWCVCNTDVVQVRITVDDVTRNTRVWTPRPDVFAAINGDGLYHAINALCSGMDDELLFDDVHDREGGCALQVEFVLVNGVVLSGPTPPNLVLNEKMVVAH